MYVCMYVCIYVVILYLFSRMVNTEQLQRVAMLKNLNYSFPLGYRFCPAEKELVFDNLRNKVRKRFWILISISMVPRIYQVGVSSLSS